MARDLTGAKARLFVPLILAQILASFGLALVAAAAVSPPGFETSAACGAALVLPFILLSPLAGAFADRFDRGFFLRLIDAAGFAASLGAAAALLAGTRPFVFLALFALAATRAMANPLRCSFLARSLPERALPSGAAAVIGGTALAILAGVIVGSEGGIGESGPALALATTAMIAAAGQIVPSVPGAPASATPFGTGLKAACAALDQSWDRRHLRLASLGCSWTFLVTAALFTTLLSFAGAGAAFLLALLCIGFAAGAAFAAAAMRNEIAARYAPPAMLGIAAFLGWLAVGPDSFGWIAGGFFGLAICGGFFVAPLWTILLQGGEEASFGGTFGAATFEGALAISIGGGLGGGFLAARLAPELFAVLAAGSAAAALLSCELLPADALKRLGRRIFRLAYRVELRGFEHLSAAGRRTLVVANHVSYLDGPLLGAFLPGEPIFAIDPDQRRHWWARPFLAAVETYALDPLRSIGIRTLIASVEEGRVCVIFPEGRINVTGGTLMKIYEGPALIADKADAAIVRVRLDGPEATPFSRLSDRLRRRYFPRIVITAYPPEPLALPPYLRGRERRRRAGLALYDLMSDMMARRDVPPSLYASLLAARRTHGGRHKILEDPSPRELSYNALLAASEILGRRLAQRTVKAETVGLLLPNSTAAAIAFFALQAFGRVPAMLNPTTGPAGVASAAQTAGLRLVVSSRRFIEEGRFAAVAERIAGQFELVYLEDLRREIGFASRLRGLFAGRFAEGRYRRLAVGPQDPAAVLFTSGSEGPPKGVVLSHVNLLMNRNQIAARVDFSPADLALNALPMFHSFGLLGGFLLPLLSGVPGYLYPSPLHYRVIPETAYWIGATVIFGTDTFLMGYARRANPYDFYALRYIFSGGEPVREETRALWFEKFGKRIFEGYGVTECGPVVAVNTPMHYLTGSVGRILPLIEYRTEKVPGIAAGGRLFVRGPNVMLGYLRPGRGKAIDPPPEGWHDSGDIVEVDEEGFAKVVGRVKRFAKIGGEMVSLALSERICEAAIPDTRQAVVAIFDPRRGEALVLVTEARDLARRQLVAAAHQLGLPDLAVPRAVVEVDRLPLLGTGKPDYPAVARIAEQARNGTGDAALQQQPRLTLVRDN